MRAGHSGHHGAQGVGALRLTDYPEINPEMAKPLLLMRGENGPVYQWGKAPLL